MEVNCTEPSPSVRVLRTGCHPINPLVEVKLSNDLVIIKKIGL
jgi:hypothetical protein